MDVVYQAGFRMRKGSASLSPPSPPPLPPDLFERKKKKDTQTYSHNAIISSNLGRKGVRCVGGGWDGGGGEALGWCGGCGEELLWNSGTCSAF